ncbi:MAG: hypothetical protein RLZZ522_1141 [Verrucomicrobiota bacterium]
MKALILVDFQNDTLPGGDEVATGRVGRRGARHFGGEDAARRTKPAAFATKGLTGHRPVS